MDRVEIGWLVLLVLLLGAMPVWWAMTTRSGGKRPPATEECVRRVDGGTVRSRECEEIGVILQTGSEGTRR